MAISPAEWHAYYRARNTYRQLLKHELDRLGVGNYTQIVTAPHVSDVKDKMLRSGRAATPVSLAGKLPSSLRGDHYEPPDRKYIDWVRSMAKSTTMFRKNKIRHSDRKWAQSTIKTAGQESEELAKGRVSFWWRGRGLGMPVQAATGDIKPRTVFNGHYFVSPCLKKMSLDMTDAIVDTVCILDIRDKKFHDHGITTFSVGGLVMKATGNSDNHHLGRYKPEPIEGWAAWSKEWKMSAFSDVSRARSTTTLSARIVKKIDSKLEGKTK